VKKNVLEKNQSTAPAPANNKVIRVLQIEDDTVDRKLVERILTRCPQGADFSVESVGQLSEAIECLSSRFYDLALVDLGLPDSKGIDIIQKVRRVSPNMPIVVLTGLDDEATGLSAIQNGATDYLIKGPALNDSLIRAVLYALERKKSEKALQESEAKFRTIFENAGGAIFIADIETGEIVDCNSKAEELVGRRRREIIGMHQLKLHPDDKGEKYKEKFAAHIQKGHTVDYEGEVLHIDGSRIPVWITAQKAKIGGKELIVGLFIDITESREAQLELQAAEERYRSIFENSAVAIMMADEQEQLISWNEFTEDLLEMDKENLYLKPVKSLYPAAEWEKIRTHSIRQKGVQHHLETKMFKNNGEIIDVNLSLSVLRDAGGKVTGSIGVISDITERKKAERKIKEAIETKSEFISTVSHELRTPLASMKEGISIVLDGAAGTINKDQKNMLGIAKRNLERLARLINDVLDFQKLDSHKMNFDMQPNDINEVVTEVYDMMKDPAKRRRLKLVLDLEKNLPEIKFDRDRIIQVLTNLVNNALKFTEKGKIAIGTRRKDNIILVSVSDTGHGIRQEDLPRLFRKFEQLEKGDDRKTGGTGLGLAISKEIIEQHNAKIWAESEVGKGTTCYFVLPIVERRAQPRKSPDVLN